MDLGDFQQAIVIGMGTVYAAGIGVMGVIYYLDRKNVRNNEAHPCILNKSKNLEGLSYQTTQDSQHPNP